MGQIAGMVSATQRSRSPLQRELDGMTKVFGVIAFAAVTVIAVVGVVRGQQVVTLLLLCISTAIASIPVGLPTFVQTMLSSGARRLAESKAVVKSLSDVETLGGTTAINTDKTGTLTMNAMTATTMLAGGDWFTVEGPGYKKTGAILGVAGAELCVLAFGPGKPSTTHASVNMTVAFAIVSLSAVNLGLVMRREREPAWSSPVFPYLGWIILGWLLTWAAVELRMLQRLLDTTSLSGGQWGTVLLLSLIAPGAVAADKMVTLWHQRRKRQAHGAR
jgi:magnesium-transporting ATPase (P-type)